MNPSDIRKSFAKAIKSRRSKLGFSQEQLAEKADLHRTYISDVERGARNLSLESIEKLARALEVSVASLFYPQKSNGNGATENALPANGVDFVEVLLVEDNPDDVDLTLAAFKRARFANRVQVARDGAEALELVFGGKTPGRHLPSRPQIILLDLNLPKVDGFEVLRRIKSDARTKHIPVVVLTISRKHRDIDESRRLGANGYLVKPVDLRGLTEVTPQLSLAWALFKPAEG